MWRGSDGRRPVFGPRGSTTESNCNGASGDANRVPGDAVVRFSRVEYNGAPGRCQFHQGRKRKPIVGKIRRNHLAVGTALTPVPETAYNRGLFADPAGSAFARAPDQAWGTR